MLKEFQKKMYVITPKNPNKHLLRYLDQPFIKTFGFNEAEKKYIINGNQCDGLKSKLCRMYYPHYVFKRKGRKRAKLRKGSTAKIGKAVDNQIQEYIRSGKKPRNALALALLAYWEQAQHTLQAAQVPVYIACLDRATQADVITEKDGQLWMWEVKTGYNQRPAQGGLLGHRAVPNNEKNHWELQRYYTHRGLVDEGLPLFASHVINVYQQKDEIVVKKRKVPEWVLKFDK